MIKRLTCILGIGIVLFGLAGCHNKNVKNPIAQVDSKQPDKILFDRAMEAMKSNKFDVARLTLQTLINTYPDSEYVARAKLAVGDSWYAEGNSAALVQAENEYKDFETFFPNMPEAAEAQLKIANIHYKQMEKPDRDFTHAKRAEDEYRQLIIQYPDSQLVPEAKQRLLEVQEVLGEREFRIGRFYYMKESWIATIARLQSLVDTYPLYSGADQALLLLGGAYQHTADAYRAANLPEALKGRMIKDAEDKAATAYDKILTRYPAMPGAEDAKKALAAMKRPIPTPTPEALAQNQKEQESRGKTGTWGTLMNNFHKGPDFARATKDGEPTMQDPQQVSAPLLLRQADKDMRQALADMQKTGGTQKVAAEVVKQGAPPPNEAPPRSDNSQSESNALPELRPVPDASESNSSTQTATPPTQLNEVEKQGDAQPAGQTSSSSSSSSSSSTTSNSDGSNASASQQQQPAQDQSTYSTSQPKKKKGLRKIVPF